MEMFFDDQQNETKLPDEFVILMKEKEDKNFFRDC